MKRNEYKLLVSQWNNFLIEEELSLKRNALLNESIRLNENKLKRFAKSLSVTLPTLLLALSAHVNSVNAQDVSGIEGGNVIAAQELVNSGKASKIIDKK